MRPDHLLMLADIAQVASERPELDETTVQALYQHLVLTQGGQPTIDELREYVDRLSSLDERTIRLRLGLGLRVARRRRNRQTELGTMVTAGRQAAARSADRHGATERGQPDLVSAERSRQTPERIGIEQSRSKSGPPPGAGLTRDEIIDAVIEHREPDGTWPTQPTVSLELGKDEGGRRIRQVQGKRGWAGILEDAEARLANR
jgi:hypothetical protein